MMRALKGLVRWLIVATIVAIVTQVAVSQAPPEQSKVVVTVKRKAIQNIKVGSQTSSTFIMQVTDSSAKPVQGLTVKDVAANKDGEYVHVTRVTPLGATPFVSNMVMLVLDNSSSMRLSADSVQLVLKPFLATLGKGAAVGLVLFEENGEWLKEHPVSLDGKEFNLSVLDFTGDNKKLVQRATTWYKSHTTRRTYLRDAITYSLVKFQDVPTRMQKSLVVFSDGKDIGSEFSRDEALALYSGDVNLYLVALNPKKEVIENIKKIQDTTHARVYEVKSTKELPAVYGKISHELASAYLVDYRGGRTVEWHLLNYVFFDHNSTQLRPEYGTALKHSETLTFDEAGFSDQMDQYHNILNVIGARLVAYPKAILTITGCNSNTGEEKGNLKLSQGRAIRVQEYLTSVWKISPNRLTVKAKNLPMKASAGVAEASQAENRRVELTSTEAGILKPVVVKTGVDQTQAQDSVREEYSLQLFDFDSSELSANHTAMLREVASTYRSVGGGTIKVVGATDNVGDSAYNTKLAASRAENACTDLEKSGVPKNAMTFEGVGPNYPRFTNSSPEGRFFNRTVNVTLTYAKQ